MKKNLAIHEVIALARAYYAMPGHVLGGSLHIALEDGNLKDRHIQWCMEEARRIGDIEGEALAAALLQMSQTQRRKIRGML